jgi:predicted transcriptional regulator of viral defense system
MKIEELLDIVGDQPLFESSLLLAGDVNPVDIGRQLSRWVKSGRIIQLRRGLYTLSPPYQKVKPHSFYTANHMVLGSYVSCHSALAHYGLIPDVVPLTISVCTGRPLFKSTPLGDFRFHHIAGKLFFCYISKEILDGQNVFIAAPEKALLDLVHLVPGSERLESLYDLRLQNLDKIDAGRLMEISERINSLKIQRAVKNIRKLISQEERKYVTV